MSNQIVISSGAKVRELEGVLTGTAGIVNALSINVPNGIPQLDSNGKILVNQLPNSVMEYKGTWNVSTNTPTLVNGVGNQGDVYLVEGAAVGGTAFNFGAGPIIFFNGDQVVYSGSIWQRASGSTGTVTSVAVTESGDALSITGSPITTSGTINIGFTGNSGQYVNGAGGLTTFPTDNITGSGASGQVTYFNGTNTITGENSFNYDASTNRLGVNTTVPNATIGANAGTDSGYSLLLKNDNANYNGIGFGTDTTYGNLIATEKLGTALSRNLTLLNQSGYISLTEAGNLGVNILNPNTGLDIYNGTSSYLWLHTANSGITGTDGVRLALFSTNTANLRNFEGAMSITSEGDFSVITLGAENFRVNSADGSIYQSKVANAMLKSVSGVITAAVAGTDYLAPSSLSAYVPYTGATANVNLGTHTLSAYNLIVNHTSGSGVAASITKGGSGEALTVVKSSGSGNAASITGGVTLLDELHLNTDLADAYIASAATWNAKMSGSGTSGQVAYFNGSNSITSEGGFIYDSSTNRLGVNTSVPNATIGADAALDSGYGLLIKTGASNYNGIGIAIDSTYGNTIETAKLGTASARNLTLLNQSGFVSLTESGSFGVGILTPNNGIDIYNSTQSQLWLHNAATGITATDGVRLALFNSKEANLRNFDGGLSITAEGDFSIITIGAENFRINSANGYVGIGDPSTLTTLLTVNGAITQTSVTSALLKTNASGTLVAAVAGTDYVIPSDLSSYVPTSRTLTINGTTYDLSANRSWTISSGVSGTTDYIPRFTSSTTIGNSDISQDATFVTLNSRALSAPRARFNTAYDNASLTLNVAGQTYMDSRTSRLYQTFNLSSMSNYMHIYDPYSTVNANGGFSIGSSSSITLLPSTSIIHFDGVNNRVGIGTNSPDSKLHVIDSSGNSLRIGFLSGSSNFNLYDASVHAFRNNGGTSEYMRITSGGFVGIGTSSPIMQLHSSKAGGNGIFVSNTTNNIGGYIYAASYGFELQATNSSNSGFTNLYVQPYGGNVLIGTTTNYSDYRFQVAGASSANSYCAYFLGGGSTSNAINIYLPGNRSSDTTYNAIALGDDLAYRFKVYGNGNVQNTNNSYGSLSDIKLKENVTDATPKLDDLLKVKIRNYNLIGEQTKQLGVIAQELEEIFPSMIDESNDFDKDGKDLGTTTKSVKYSVFVPMLIKAIQELKAEIDELKNK
jgi:hypothetical protein